MAAFHAPLHRFETRSLRGGGASSLRLHRDDVEDQHRRRDAAAAAAAAEAFAALPAVEAPTTVDGFEVEELATVEVVARLRSAAQVRAGAAMDSPKVSVLPAATESRCDRRVVLPSGAARVRIVEPAAGWLSAKMLEPLRCVAPRPPPEDPPELAASTRARPPPPAAAARRGDDAPDLREILRRQREARRREPLLDEFEEFSRFHHESTRRRPGPRQRATFPKAPISAGCHSLRADSWTSDPLSERSRRADASFSGTRARGTLASKRRRIARPRPRHQRAPAAATCPCERSDDFVRDRAVHAALRDRGIAVVPDAFSAEEAGAMEREASALDAVPNSNLQPDFNVSVCDSFDATSSAVLRELDESNRFVQRSAESTSI